MTKEELKKFMKWYHLNGKHLEQSSMNEKIDEYFNFLNSKPQNESPNIRQNEEQVRNCETCKYCDVLSEREPCAFCYNAKYWEAIPIVPTEGHSA